MSDYKNGSDALIAKWGNEVFDDGVTNIPQCVMRYSRRFIKATHFQLVCNIMSYQYGSDAPYPSRETIAYNMGISVKRVGILLSELEEDEWITIYPRYKDGKRTTSEYSFKNLLDACLEFSKQEKAKRDEEQNIKTYEKKTKRKKKTPESIEPQLKEQSVPLDKEQSVPDLKEQSVPSDIEQSVPRKKESEERSSNKEIRIKNLSSKIMKMNIPKNVQVVLLDKIDRLIALQINLSDIQVTFDSRSKDIDRKQFAHVLSNCLDVEKIKVTFKGLLNTSIDTYLNNLSKKEKVEVEEKPVRVGRLPKWIDKEKEEPKKSTEEQRKAFTEVTEEDEKKLKELLASL